MMKRIILCMGFLLLCLAVALPTVVSVVIFSDTFSIPPETAGQPPTQWTTIGYWNITNDEKLQEYQSDSVEYEWAEPTALGNLTEFEAEIETTPIKDHGIAIGGWQVECGIFFRKGSHPTYEVQGYFFGVSHGYSEFPPSYSCYYALYDFPNYWMFEWQEILSDSYEDTSAAYYNKTYRFRVVMDEAYNIQAYHNDTLMFDVNVEDFAEEGYEDECLFPEGTVGVYVWDWAKTLQATFDNVVYDDLASSPSPMAEAVAIAAPYAFAAVSIMSLSLIIGIGAAILVSYQTQDFASMIPVVILGVGITIALFIALPLLNAFQGL